MRRLRAQDTCSRFGISRKARKRINCSIQVFVAANCPAAQIVVIYVSPTRHQDNFAGNKSRHRRPFPPFRFRQSSFLVCGFTTRAWPPLLAAPMVIRAGSWHWPSPSRVQQDVLPLSNQDKPSASPSHSLCPNHCFLYASKAFEFRCRPSLHYGDHLQLLLAETTVWRSPPSAGSSILLSDQTPYC